MTYTRKECNDDLVVVAVIHRLQFGATTSIAPVATEGDTAAILLPAPRNAAQSATMRELGDIAMVGSNVTAETWRSGRVTSHDDDAIRGDPRLGSIGQLKGTWLNAEGFEGRMWNMIALPFGPIPQFPFQYRLLLNQGNERLRFSVGDLGVANRGLDQHDQHLAALMYLQEIDQIMAVDAAVGPTGAPVPATPDVNDTPKGSTFQPEPPNMKTPGTVGIHRESGIFFRLGGQTGPCDNPSKPGPDLGRMASIPHGDTVLALSFDGNNPPAPGAPNFADPAVRAAFDPFPIGLGDPDLNQPYLAPYKLF